MAPGPNPIRWDMGWVTFFFGAMGVMYFTDSYRKLGIDGYIVAFHQDKTDEEIYFEMLNKKLEMERYRITSEVEQPIWGNMWAQLKAEWRMWLFPRMEAEEKFIRPLWRPLNEIRPDLYDKTKRQKLVDDMEYLKKLGHLTTGFAGGGHDRALDVYINQIRKDFGDADGPPAAADAEGPPADEELQKERGEDTRRLRKMQANERVFYEPKSAVPPAAM